jgi:hypothetical protein
MLIFSPPIRIGSPFKLEIRKERLKSSNSSPGLLLIPNDSRLFPQPSSKGAEDENDGWKVHRVINRIKPSLAQVAFGDSAGQSNGVYNKRDRHDSIPAIIIPRSYSEACRSQQVSGKKYEVKRSDGLFPQLYPACDHLLNRWRRGGVVLHCPLLADQK